MAQSTPVQPKQSKDRPVFYLLAGPNGAGKSTLYKALVQNGTIAPTAEFVNADLYEAAYLQHMGDSQATEAGTHKAVAVCKGAVTQVLVAPLPKWARLVLESG